MSHDLRTPLTSILGYLQLLEGEELSRSKKAEYLAVIEGRAKTLQVFIAATRTAHTSSNTTMRMFFTAGAPFHPSYIAKHDKKQHCKQT